MLKTWTSTDGEHQQEFDEMDTKNKKIHIIEHIKIKHILFIIAEKESRKRQ